MNKDFHYMGFCTVKDGKVVVHNTQWVLRDPVFKPENFSTREEMAMAVFGGKLPKDGHYSLVANGDVRFDNEVESFNAVLLLDSYGHSPVADYVIEHWTNPQPARFIAVNVKYEVKPAY